MDTDSSLLFSENEHDEKTVFLSVNLNHHHKCILDYLRGKIVEDFLPQVFCYATLAMADCAESEVICRNNPRLFDTKEMATLDHFSRTRNINFPTWMKSFVVCAFYRETIICIENTDEVISKLNGITKEKKLSETFCHILRFIIYLYVNKMLCRPVICVSKYNKERFKKIKTDEVSSEVYGYFDLFSKYDFHFILPN